MRRKKRAKRAKGGAAKGKQPASASHQPSNPNPTMVVANGLLDPTVEAALQNKVLKQHSASHDVVSEEVALGRAKLAIDGPDRREELEHTLALIRAFYADGAPMRIPLGADVREYYQRSCIALRFTKRANLSPQDIVDSLQAQGWPERLKRVPLERFVPWKDILARGKEEEKGADADEEATTEEEYVPEEPSTDEEYTAEEPTMGEETGSSTAAYREQFPPAALSPEIDRTATTEETQHDEAGPSTTVDPQQPPPAASGTENDQDAMQYATPEDKARTMAAAELLDALLAAWEPKADPIATTYGTQENQATPWTTLIQDERPTEPSIAWQDLVAYNPQTTHPNDPASTTPPASPRPDTHTDDHSQANTRNWELTSLRNGLRAASQDYSNLQHKYRALRAKYRAKYRAKCAALKQKCASLESELAHRYEEDIQFEDTCRDIMMESYSHYARHATLEDGVREAMTTAVREYLNGVLIGRGAQEVMMTALAEYREKVTRGQ